MRIGALLCLLLAGAAFCAQPTVPPDSGRPSLTSGCPTNFHELVVSLSGPAAYPQTRFSSIFDSSRIHDTIVKYLQNPQWKASEPHPFLARILPRVSFVAVSYGAALAPSYARCAVTDEGRVYQVQDLDSLLLAEGFTFDAAQMQTIAKVAVLVACFMSPPPQTETAVGAGRDARPSAWSLSDQAFPSVTFRSFSREVGKAQPYGIQDTRLTAECTVNGKEETVVCVFHRTPDGRNWLRRVNSPGKHLAF